MNAASRESESGDPVAGGPDPLVVAYVMSRFPKLTETFVLDEMGAVERQGVRIELFPLLRERGGPVHPEAIPWVERAHYRPFLSPSIVASNLRYLVRRPGTYLRTLVAMVRGTWRSPNFLIGGLGIFPKVVDAGFEMRRLGVRHVHCHFANHPALAGYLIHRLHGIPYSFTAHGSDLHVDKTMLAEKIREASAAVTISDSNSRVIASAIGRAAPNLVLIHCGIDRDRFIALDRAGVGRERTERPFVILSVGTLHEVKGQRYLLAACRRLAAQGIPFVCQFIGDGPDRAALERLAAEVPSPGRVEFLGQRTRDDVIRALRDADVLVAPSVPTKSGKREGLPVVLIEAMASGLPVVASNLSGIPELVVDGVTGLTTPPGDSEAIAAAIERLLREPALGPSLARAGQDRVAAEFDLDRNASRLIQLFRASAA